MTEQMEKDMQAELDKEFGATRLRVALPRAETPPLTMAERLLDMGKALTEIQKDIDDLNKEFDRRLNEIRKRIGGK